MLRETLAFFQMFPWHVRLRIVGAVWYKKFTMEAKTEQQLIRHIESKMKEFDTNFVESLFWGVQCKSQIYMW